MTTTEALNLLSNPAALGGEYGNSPQVKKAVEVLQGWSEKCSQAAIDAVLIMADAIVENTTLKARVVELEGALSLMETGKYGRNDYVARCQHLEAEVATLIKFASTDQSDRLQSTIHTLEKDKLRLDWLESNRCDLYHSHQDNTWGATTGDRIEVEPTIRGAIDAAMTPNKEGKL